VVPGDNVGIAPVGGTSVHLGLGGGATSSFSYL